MHDPRLDKLATVVSIPRANNVLTTHSTLKIQPGEFVLIEGIDIPQEMVIALIRAVRKAGGIPLDVEHQLVIALIRAVRRSRTVSNVRLFSAETMLE